MIRSCAPSLPLALEVTAADDAAVAGAEASEWMISEMDQILGLEATTAGEELLPLLEELVLEDCEAQDEVVNVFAPQDTLQSLETVEPTGSGTLGTP